MSQGKSIMRGFRNIMIRAKCTMISGDLWIGSKLSYFYTFTKNSLLRNFSQKGV